MKLQIVRSLFRKRPPDSSIEIRLFEQHRFEPITLVGSGVISQNPVIDRAGAGPLTRFDVKDCLKGPRADCSKLD